MTHFVPPPTSPSRCAGSSPSPLKGGKGLRQLVSTERHRRVRFPGQPDASRGVLPPRVSATQQHTNRPNSNPEYDNEDVWEHYVWPKRNLNVSPQGITMVGL